MHSLFRIQSIAHFIICALFFTSALSFAQNPTVANLRLDELRESGFRLDWITPSNTADVHLTAVGEDSIYTLDSEDYISRYELDSGEWIWSAPAGNQVFTIRSITEVPEDNRIYLMADGAIYVLERETGNMPFSSSTKDKLANSNPTIPLKIFSNTGALEHNNEFLVYGGSTGEIVWFNPSIGFHTNIYKVGKNVKVNPTHVFGPRSKDGQDRSVFIASATDGNVMAIDTKQARKQWALQFTNPVEVEVSFGTQAQPFNDELYPRTSVFIAGTDQYLRSVDLHSGKSRWSVLTSKDLVDSPVFLQDTVYQRIPEVGLASYKAFPRLREGEINWVAEEVQGNVLTTRKGKLVVWDNVKNIIQIVDTRKGGVVATLSIPDAKEVVTDNVENGSIFVLTQDNSLLHLAQR